MENDTVDRDTSLWSIESAVKDQQSITADWDFTRQRLIDGVTIREIRNVPKENGYLTEIFRSDWGLGAEAIGQVFQVVLSPLGASAWHAHAETIDRLFVSHGIVRINLFDAREGSPTFGLVNEFRFGTIRPALVVVPPRVWHGVVNLADEPSSILNLVDKAYRYESPDHWRVPPDSGEIPCCILHGVSCGGRHTGG